jgi:steroid delta-isomerase-like uncharacterized protein
MTETEIRTLVEQFLEAWNRRDLDTLLTFMDESVTWSDPAMLYGPAVGKAAVREFCENVLRAFPDFTYRLREPICVSGSCERCAIPWEITATHTGPFEPVGFAPTNQTITMEGVDLIDFSGTKLKRIETLFNAVTAAEQALGLKPFPRKGIRRAVIVGLQRACAWSLRRRSRKGG